MKLCNHVVKNRKIRLLLPLTKAKQRCLLLYFGVSFDLSCLSKNPQVLTSPTLIEIFFSRA
uniref:Phosphoglycerate mutase n=1 Tax=Solanum tuberosum TaxID=4113 RepID=M1AK79_SOLTU